MNKQTVIRYVFNPYFNGYFQDKNFYDATGHLLKQKYYNGRVCINCHNKRFGLKTLKKYATKVTIVADELPF